MKYNDHFWVGACDVSNRGRQYVEGLLLNRGRGNCSRFAKTVRKSTSQSLQNFITDSPWDERKVIERLQRDIAELIGDPVEGSIHIDETGFPKQGTHSVLKGSTAAGLVKSITARWASFSDT
jgi:SRSO17 transposase